MRIRLVVKMLDSRSRYRQFKSESGQNDAFRFLHYGYLLAITVMDTRGALGGVVVLWRRVKGRLSEGAN